MKYIVAFCLFLCFAGFVQTQNVTLNISSVISLVPGDNSKYIEGVSRYIWMPDGDGVPILVDLQASVDQAFLEAVNGSDNQYWLFTSKQVIIYGEVDSINNTNYNASNSLKVIVHDWNSTGASEYYPLITAEYLQVADVNVVVVDWSAVAKGSYTTVIEAVPSVGENLGNFLVWLINNGGGSWSNVHLVGFGLGAHIAGIAGRTANSLPGFITGLDPTGPGWTDNASALNDNDGLFVEVIHTNVGTIGISTPLGTIDLYPNGGEGLQPGCYSSSCSHQRALALYAASVRNNSLVAKWCASLTEASDNRCTGFNLTVGTRGPRGIYAMSTGSAFPF